MDYFAVDSLRVQRGKSAHVLAEQLDDVDRWLDGDKCRSRAHLLVGTGLLHFSNQVLKALRSRGSLHVVANIKCLAVPT